MDQNRYIWSPLLHARLLSALHGGFAIFAPHGVHKYPYSFSLSQSILPGNAVSFAHDWSSLFRTLFGHNCRIWVLLCVECRFWVSLVRSFGLLDDPRRVSMLEWNCLLERTFRLDWRLDMGLVSAHSAFDFRALDEVRNFAAIRDLHVFGTSATNGQKNQITLL